MLWLYRGQWFSISEMYSTIRASYMHHNRRLNEKVSEQERLKEQSLHLQEIETDSSHPTPMFWFEVWPTP